MDDRAWRLLKDVFHQALECEPDERARLLDEACSGEPEVRDELEALLAVHECSQGFPEVPREIGEFQIVREIGRGGMGVVYEAVQVPMQRRVALKVLSAAFLHGAHAVHRFQREARAAGRLHHTNIVPIHAMGQHAGMWYYAMELVDGCPLNRVVAELKQARSHGGVSQITSDHLGTDTQDRAYFPRVARAFADVADALDTAHEAGVIHRDIKPSNLLMDQHGRLMIVDFGLARLDGGEASMTLTGDLLGTPVYMSPEQALAKHTQIDHRTDIYSLGATLYEVLTLEPPYRGTSLHDVCEQIATRDPALPGHINRFIPKDLETVVFKAMEKDRNKRYRTAGELADDLCRFADGASIRARRIGPLGRAWRKIKRHKVRSSLVGTVILLGALAAGLALHASSQSARALELEYARACARADAALATSARDMGGSILQRGSVVGESARDLYGRAIELLPGRPEAYLGRALSPGGTPAERDEDIEQALRCGLSRRAYHLARAYVRTRDRRPIDAERERELAGAHPRNHPLDLYLEARLLGGLGETDDAIRLLQDAVRSADRGSAAHYLALRYRGELRARAGLLDDALADLHAVRALGDESAATRIRVASVWQRLEKRETATGLFADTMQEIRKRDDPAAWLDLCQACATVREDAWHDRATEEALRRYPRSVDLLVERAIARRRSGEHEDAIGLCERALALSPRHHRAHEAKGDALQRRERHREAVEAYDRALDADPRCANAHYSRAGSLLQAGEAARALEGFDRALKLAPASGPAWTGRGVALRRLGDVEGARAALERALEIDDGQPYAHVALGALLCDEDGQYDAALAAFKRALELAPELALAHYNRGNALSHLGRNGDALAALTRAAKLDPRNPDAHWSRGITLARLKRYAEAAAAHDQALEIEPQHLDALRDKGVALEARGRDREALAAYERALEVDSTFMDAHMNRGVVLVRLGRPGDALEAFERAIDLAPGNPTPLMGKADALYVLRKRDAALRIYDAVLDLDPKNTRALNNRGFVLRELGRLEPALDSFRRLADAAPRSPAGPYLAGTTLVMLGRNDDALAEFDRAHVRAPGAPEPLIERAHTLRRLRRFDEARRAYDHAHRLDTKRGIALLSRGRLLRDMQRYEEALADYEAVIRDVHESPDVVVERALVLALLGRLDESRTALKPAVERGWDGIAVLRPLWECLWILGRHAEALAVASKLVSHDAGFTDRKVVSLRALGRTEEARAAAADALRRPPQPDERIRFAYLRAVAGEPEAARALLKNWGLPWTPEDLYARSRVHAVLDEKEAALSWLERAAEAGLRRPSREPLDPDFGSLADEPRYRAFRAAIARR